MLRWLDPGKHMKAGQARSARKTPFKFRFAGGPLVARNGMLAGIFVPYITCADPEGWTGSPDPLENYKATKPAF